MSVYRLLIELVGKDRGATQKLRAVKNEALGLEQAAQKLQSGLAAAAGIAGMAYVGKQAIDLVADLYTLGAQALRTEASFDKLAGRIGTTGDALLQAMRRASEGTIDDMTLMQVTAGLLASGIKTSTGEITLALDIAQLKAQQFGLTTTEAYSRMLTGARKFSVEMLDEIGITIKAESAYKRMADSLDVTVKALTDAQRAEALWRAILEDGRAEIEEYGGATLDAASDIEVLTAAFTNLKMGIGETVAGFEPLTQNLQILAALASGRGWELFAEKALEGAKAGSAVDAAIVNLLRNMAGLKPMIIEATGAMDPFVEKLEHQKGAEEEAAQATTNLTWTLYGLDAAMNQTLTTGAAFEQMWLDIGQTASAIGMELDAVMRGLQATTAEELVGGFGGTATKLDAALLGLTGLSSATAIKGIREDYQAEIRGLYDDVAFQIAQGTDVSEFEIELQAAAIYEKYKDVIGSIEGSTDGIKKAIADQSRAWDDLKSTVEAALGGGTSVTALDMAQTAAGTYADKWDEDARQLDAIAARGFAELDAHPDWAGMLGIPPEILNSTEAALKEWAQRQSDNFRNLLLPLDEGQVSAAVDKVRQYVQQQAQREENIEIIAGAYVAQYGGTEEQARAALGDTEATGGIAADEVMAGFTAALTANSPAMQFASYMKSDIEAATVPLKTRGEELWDTMETGFLGAMKSGDYGQEFARILVPFVIEELNKRGTWTGGGNPP